MKCVKWLSDVTMNYDEWVSEWVSEWELKDVLKTRLGPRHTWPVISASQVIPVHLSHL